MKTIFAISTRLFIFTIIIASIYSFRNYRSFPKFAGPKYEAVAKKTITLTGAEEVPAVSPSGSGTLDVSYDKNTKTLTYSATWTGMTDSVTMMHFHGPAARGANAGVVYPIPEFTRGTAGTAKGTVKLDEVKTKEADLLGGKWYYNVHTKTHPGGEIRGQVEF
jgi:hypothetical protein